MNSDDKKEALVEATVEAHAQRIARKLREKAARDDVTEREREARNAALMRAMTTTRKALLGTIRLPLGDRFGLDLDVDDWEGWPRLHLNLVDGSLNREAVQSLIISAHERADRAFLRLGYENGDLLTKFDVIDGTELDRLAPILKAAVSAYLNRVTSYVMAPPSPEDSVVVQSRPIESDLLDEEIAQGEDLFQDGAPRSTKNLVDVADEDSTEIPL